MTHSPESDQPTTLQSLVEAFAAATTEQVARYEAATKDAQATLSAVVDDDESSFEEFLSALETFNDVCEAAEQAFLADPVVVEAMAEFNAGSEAYMLANPAEFVGEFGEVFGSVL